MTTTQEEFIPTRQTLLTRLKNWDDQESWRAFFNMYSAMIYNVARRSGLSDAEAQDVVQETIIAVAKKMPNFKYHPALGSFKAWLLQITRCRIIDQLRKQQYESGGLRHQREERLSTSLLETKPDTSACELDEVWDEEWKKNLMESAIERVKQKVSPRYYQMFYLHVCKEIPAQTVAQKLDMKLAEVYFAKYKVSRLLQKEIKLLEQSMF